MVHVSELRWVRFVAAPDGSTPESSLPYVGQTVGMRVEDLPDGGTPDNPGYLMGLRGYFQQGTDGAAEWVLTSVIGSALARTIRDLPPDGWKEPGCRQVWRQAARTLIETWRLPEADVGALFQQLHGAAITNERTPAVTP